MMPRVSTSLSLVPNSRMAHSLTATGVRSTSAAPTAVTGAASGRTAAAVSSAEASPANAAASPLTAPRATGTRRGRPERLGSAFTRPVCPGPGSPRRRHGGVSSQAGVRGQPAGAVGRAAAMAAARRYGSPLGRSGCRVVRPAHSSSKACQSIARGAVFPTSASSSDAK